MRQDMTLVDWLIAVIVIGIIIVAFWKIFF